MLAVSHRSDEMPILQIMKRKEMDPLPLNCERARTLLISFKNVV
jgi:hypothetical protein